MKTKLLSVLSALFLLSCSIEEANKSENVTPENGKDGTSSYWDIQGNCATPIYYIGNINNIVERGETTCFENGVDGENGQDGQSTEIKLNTEDNCLTITTFIEDKFVDSKTICTEKGEKGDPGKDGINGKDGEQGDPGQDGTDGVDGENGEQGPKGDRGEDGTNGQDGKDGTSSRIRFEDEPIGENCEHGGTKVISYVLETGEIVDTSYICNLKCYHPEPNCKTVVIDTQRCNGSEVPYVFWINSQEYGVAEFRNLDLEIIFESNTAIIKGRVISNNSNNQYYLDLKLTGGTDTYDNNHKEHSCNEQDISNYYFYENVTGSFKGIDNSFYFDITGTRGERPQIGINANVREKRNIQGISFWFETNHHKYTIGDVNISLNEICQ